MTNNITVESKILLDLLANTLFDSKIEIDLSGVDIKKLFDEAKIQTVVATAFDSLPSKVKEYNPEVYLKWQMFSFSLIKRNMEQLHKNGTLETLFAKSGLPICTIKGFTSAYYYHNKMHLRQMGDIDFIVPISKVEDSKKLLLENDFKCTDVDEIHDFHIGYRKDGTLFEMHKGITSFLDENGYVDKYIKDIFDNTIVADFGTTKITVPNTFAHGLIMLLHLQRHMIDGGGVGLRHLCDWAVFVNSISNDEWVTTFEKRLKRIKLWKFAQSLSKVSSLYLKMSEKDWFAKIDEQLAEELLLDILSSGNFGRKDIERSQELFFVSQNDKEKNKLTLLFNSYIRNIYSWKPFYKHHKWLLPVGAVAYFFRTVFLILFHKKKINLYETYKKGTARNNLYNNIFK